MFIPAAHLSQYVELGSTKAMCARIKFWKVPGEFCLGPSNGALKREEIFVPHQHQRSISRSVDQANRDIGLAKSLVIYYRVLA